MRTPLLFVTLLLLVTQVFGMVTIVENGASCEDTIIAPEATRNAPLVAYERQHTPPLGALAIFVANKVQANFFGIA